MNDPNPSLALIWRTALDNWQKFVKIAPLDFGAIPSCSLLPNYNVLGFG